jgi:hypothetical protein
MNIAVGEKTTDMPFGHRTQQTPHLVTEQNEQPNWPTVILTSARGNAPGTYVKTQRWMAPQDSV